MLKRKENSSWVNSYCLQVHSVTFIIFYKIKFLSAGRPKPAKVSTLTPAAAARKLPQLTSLLPPRPNALAPWATSYSEVTRPFCRLPLLHIILSARGCSPWAPAAVYGTSWWEAILQRIFKERRVRTGPHKMRGSSGHCTPSPVKLIPGQVDR
jgi:hypothetical protein